MSFLPLDIDPKALAAMTDHAEVAFPTNAAAFSMARGRAWLRDHLHEVTNSKKVTSEGDLPFLTWTTPGERHAAEGLTLLGVYHSIPAPGDSE